MPRRSAARWPTACATFGATTVLSPALGGLIIGHEVARALGARAIFAEREDGVLRLRRGFTLADAERVLVVEDVVTTGGSTRETIQVATAAGAQVLAAVSVVNRSGGKATLDVPLHSLLELSLADLRPRRLPALRPGPADCQARVAPDRGPAREVGEDPQARRRLRRDAFRRLAAAGRGRLGAVAARGRACPHRGAARLRRRRRPNGCWRPCPGAGGELQPGARNCRRRTSGGR